MPRNSAVAVLLAPLLWAAVAQHEEPGCSSGVAGESDGLACATNGTVALQIAAVSRGPLSCLRSPAPARVVSFADVHGDYRATVELLQALGIVCSTVSLDSSWFSSTSDLWCGGSAQLVQTGDWVNRWSDQKTMILFLWALQDQAPASGGKVFLLMGNHELFLIQGDYRYVTAGDFAQYASAGVIFDRSSHYPTIKAPSGKAFPYTQQCTTFPGGSKSCMYARTNCAAGSGCPHGFANMLKSWDINGEMGTLLRKRISRGRVKVAQKIADVVYVHAGLVDTIWDKLGVRSNPGGALAALQKALVDVIVSSPMKVLYQTPSSPVNGSQIVIAGQNDGGPMWTRVGKDTSSWAAGNEGPLSPAEEKLLGSTTPCESIRNSLRFLGASRMVIGHNIQCSGPLSPGVYSACSGQLILADTCMSRGYAQTTANSDHNLAAVEFDASNPGRIWAVYPKRAAGAQCVEAGAAGSAPDGTLR